MIFVEHLLCAKYHKYFACVGSVLRAGRFYSFPFNMLGSWGPQTVNNLDHTAIFLFCFILFFFLSACLCYFHDATGCWAGIRAKVNVYGRSCNASWFISGLSYYSHFMFYIFYMMKLNYCKLLMKFSKGNEYHSRILSYFTFVSFLPLRISDFLTFLWKLF